jgi:hypothetical protein
MLAPVYLNFYNIKNKLELLSFVPVRAGLSLFLQHKKSTLVFRLTVGMLLISGRRPFSSKVPCDLATLKEGVQRKRGMIVLKLTELADGQ